MCMFNNVYMIALLLLWTGLIKGLGFRVRDRVRVRLSFMESLFKSDMATQDMENYSGSNRKM